MSAVSKLAIDAMKQISLQAKRQEVAIQHASKSIGKLPFRQEYGACEAHGQYPINIRDERGIERSFSGGCPICARTRNARKIIDRGEIAPRFANCEFDNYVTTTQAQISVLEACKNYANEIEENIANGRCMIMTGNVGTGKNHLAVAITKAALKKGKTSVHLTAYELICRIRETWTKKNESEMDVIKKLGSIDLLVIDEIGRQNNSANELLHLFNVLDCRYKLKKPTIVISNLSASGIEESIGAAQFDRLKQGGGVLVKFDWEGQRVRA